MNISSTRPTSGTTSISSGYSSSRLSSTSSSLGSSSIGRSTGSSYRSTGSSSIGTGSSSFGSRSVKESIGSGYSNMYKSVSSIGSKIYQSFLGRAASRRYWRSSEVKLFISAKIWQFRLKLYQTVPYKLARDFLYFCILLSNLSWLQFAMFADISGFLNFNIFNWTTCCLLCDTISWWLAIWYLFLVFF